MGSGSYQQCLNLTKTYLLVETTLCELTPCSFNGVYQPSLTDGSTDFYLTSAYGYAQSFFGLPTSTSINSFITPTQTICAQNFSDAYAQAPASSKDFVYSYCFLGTFIVAILGDGYGLPMDKSLNFLSSINGTEVTYSLGAMIVEANLLPYSVPETCPSSATTTITQSFLFELINKMYSYLSM